MQPSLHMDATGSNISVYGTSSGGGQTVANAATVGLSSSGKITIHVANQGAYVVLDVAGYIM